MMTVHALIIQRYRMVIFASEDVGWSVKGIAGIVKGFFYVWG